MTAEGDVSGTQGGGPADGGPRFPAPAAAQVDLLIIAGEHSGDEHAATMVRELRRKHPGLTVAALGGPPSPGQVVEIASRYDFEPA